MKHISSTSAAANIMRTSSISVCMAAYNGACYIGEQVASILLQLGAGDELVVVDDVSSDGTVAVLSSIRDDRIRIVRNTRNAGAVRTFERALRESTGDIIFLSDQDDIWMPDKVSTMMRAFADRRATLVLSNGELIDASGRSMGLSLNSTDRFAAGLLANLVKNRYQGCTMAFRREVLESALPFPDSIPMHDSWIGLVNEVVGRTVYIPEKLVLYRRHGGNVTTRKHGTIGRMLAQRWRLAISLAGRIGTLMRTRRELRSGAAIDLNPCTRPTVRTK